MRLLFCVLPKHGHRIILLNKNIHIIQTKINQSKYSEEIIIGTFCWGLPFMTLFIIIEQITVIGQSEAQYMQGGHTINYFFLINVSKAL